ncbi:hypothetical protein [Granulicella mallensis]|jgi:hypothetical protein|uniref:Secreted protein n=1 Tax=Granulicella mallensis TaxID=940614 RepID=A0A7W7ZV02_9BACT|nr:hypothetical protein [Granulicella mallensis]MBB5066623.1 hypothetical protein [Granulicella mallensis]
MRRALTLLLLAVFGLPTVAPLLAMGQDTDSHLPICCRRNGDHHCAMGMSQPTTTPAVSARCPHFPQPTVPSPTGTFAALVTPAQLVQIDLSILAAPQRADTQRRISRERSRHKRGPPAVHLS